MKFVGTQKEYDNIDVCQIDIFKKWKYEIQKNCVIGTAAYASFEEDIKGTLEIGKYADFVVLSENLFKIEPTTIRDVKILETYVNGKSVYIPKWK